MALSFPWPNAHTEPALREVAGASGLVAGESPAEVLVEAPCLVRHKGKLHNAIGALSAADVIWGGINGVAAWLGVSKL